MNPQLPQDELFQAGVLLFGHSFFPRGLSSEAWQNELRVAFRRRAFETHPDRASILERSEAELAAEFKALYRAYRILEALPAAPTTGERPRSPAGQKRAVSKPAGAGPVSEPANVRRDHLYDGPLPSRLLRLAEFLYYSGRITFWDMVEAVSWQRLQRPSVGRIAVERGHLTNDQVFRILESRRRDRALQTPFGEYALQKGHLTTWQLDGILGRQRLLQERIGRYFVSKGMLQENDILAARREMQRHNAEWRV